MNDLELQNLVARGAVTFEKGQTRSTIDLFMATERLVDEVVSCRLWEHEYGSDHRAILAEFDTDITTIEPQERLLFKHANWQGVRGAVTARLGELPPAENIERFLDKLMTIVQEAVRRHTPVAKPSPYAKRWWTQELTELRRDYTRWRNEARRTRRAGALDRQLEPWTVS
jgi:hypothetical protein